MSVNPQYAVSDQSLIRVSNYPTEMRSIPTSRMFVIKQALKTYIDNVGGETYDASQGDGGKSLSGVPTAILEQAFQLQCEVGTGYDTPAGHPRFRQAVAESYWQFDATNDYGPNNVLAGQGGRDVLMKAYNTMLHLGHRQVGDALITSTVPWVSYNWGPYAAGLNVLRAAGDPEQAWAYTENALEETVAFAKKTGRNAAGIIITSPDNPTGRTMSLERQIVLAQKALSLDVAFVLFDWIYHWVTEDQPHDINVVLNAFSPEDRARLMFMDGLTKSLGGSNVRNAHLVASEKVIKHISSQASHGVIPSFYSQAVAITAYEMGYGDAAAPIIEPTNASRQVLHSFLQDKGYEFIMGDGYYAFINVEQWVKAQNFEDTVDLGQMLAEEHGIAVVPGRFFSPAGKYWFRFSYALPPERTAAAVNRFHEALSSLT